MSILCPTQLLASQHVKSIEKYASMLKEHCNWNVRAELLTGSVVGKSRSELFDRLQAAGERDVIFLIGTHALSSPDVVKRLSQLSSATSKENTGLALAVIDEEQRFGVSQRQIFASCAAHSLSMTATPIPRSVNMANSGLMDLTQLELENPRSIETTIVPTDAVDKVVAVLRSKIENNSKAFWVLPRIDPNQKDDAEDGLSQHSNVMARHNALVEALGRERVSHVHGRMKQSEREEQLKRFSDPSSEAAVLVGTTVIEGE